MLIIDDPYVVYMEYTNKVVDEAVLLMFFNMLQVLVGNYAVGTQDIARPPQNEHGDIYDSCVDNLKKPKIFVSFDIAHSYPAYLITY